MKERIAGLTTYIRAGKTRPPVNKHGMKNRKGTEIANARNRHRKLNSAVVSYRLFTECI